MAPHCPNLQNNKISQRGNSARFATEVQKLICSQSYKVCQLHVSKGIPPPNPLMTKNTDKHHPSSSKIVLPKEEGVVEARVRPLSFLPQHCSRLLSLSAAFPLSTDVRRDHPLPPTLHITGGSQGSPLPACPSSNLLVSISSVNLTSRERATWSRRVPRARSTA